ncbi:MAG: hypothetical protein HY243_01605 [Proteobacteria bacterium]|nr:hypothetical protein [Pseudomonadota bacterium]
MLAFQHPNSNGPYNAPWRDRVKRLGDAGPGLLGSLALHGIAVLLLMSMLVKTMTQPGPKEMRTVPVDVVQLGEETVSPPADQRSLAPQQSASRHEPSVVKPQGVAPNKTHEPVDELEAKLKQFAKLRQPDSSSAPIDNAGTSDVTASSDAAPGRYASYSVRDYVRAQVLRRWSLDLAKLGNRNFTILLYVELSGRGTVTKADIVDQSRYRSDPIFREIALSARNALILSSPLKLPDGQLPEGAEFTISLNPRDTLR